MIYGLSSSRHLNAPLKLISSANFCRKLVFASSVITPPEIMVETPRSSAVKTDLNP